MSCRNCCCWHETRPALQFSSRSSWTHLGVLCGFHPDHLRLRPRTESFSTSKAMAKASCFLLTGMSLVNHGRTSLQLDRSSFELVSEPQGTNALCCALNAGLTDLGFFSFIFWFGFVIWVTLGYAQKLLPAQCWGSFLNEYAE